jgi:hypothetical protein
MEAGELLADRVQSDALAVDWREGMSCAQEL